MQNYELHLGTSASLLISIAIKIEKSITEDCYACDLTPFSFFYLFCQKPNFFTLGFEPREANSRTGESNRLVQKGTSTSLGLAIAKPSYILT